jgi:hypothetical protein
MTSDVSTRSLTGGRARRFIPLGALIALAALALPATAASPDRAHGAERSDNGSLSAWHQGFQRDTDGWVGAETTGLLGWCGSIERVDTRGLARAAIIEPSAGTGYASVRAGACNDYWSAAGVPGGSPYALGPAGTLPTSGGWPAPGYVDQLDVYLDPAWAGRTSGLLSFAYPDTVLQLAATVFERDYQPGDFHPGPHWVTPVDVVDGENALSVLGHRIVEAGWYTFRFAFSGVDGLVQADFELRSDGGRVVVAVEDMTPQALAGPVLVPFDEPLPTDEYATGYLWFFDSPVTIGTVPATPVPVAIDEHLIRPGR